jgi:hypothetical protein
VDDGERTGMKAAGALAPSSHLGATLEEQSRNRTSVEFS